MTSKQYFLAVLIGIVAYTLASKLSHITEGNYGITVIVTLPLWVTVINFTVSGILGILMISKILVSEIKEANTKKLLGGITIGAIIILATLPPALFPTMTRELVYLITLISLLYTLYQGVVCIIGFNVANALASRYLKYQASK